MHFFLFVQSTPARPVLLEQANSFFACKKKKSVSCLLVKKQQRTALWAISARLLCVVVFHHVWAVAIGRLAFWHLSCHCHSNDFEPALLKLLTLRSKVVDRLGLWETEAGRSVCGSGAVVHSVTQEGDRTLGLHILGGSGGEGGRVIMLFECEWFVCVIESLFFFFLPFYLRSSVEVEHQTLLLWDDAPHFLPGFVLLTVLQEAAHDAAARELSCLDLHRDDGGRPQVSTNQYLHTTYQLPLHLGNPNIILTSRMPFFLPSVTPSPVRME